MNRPLVPGFLKKYDDYLLRNKPDTWSLRLHLVAYYSLLVTIIITALYLLLNYNLPWREFAASWMPYLILLSTIGFVVYVIYLLRFNVFKRFGKLNHTVHSAKHFIYYFLAFVLIFMPCYIPLLADYLVTRKQFSLEQMRQDADKFNLAYGILTKQYEQAFTTQQAMIVEDSNSTYLQCYRLKDSIKELLINKVQNPSLPNLEQANLPYETLYLTDVDSPSFYEKSWQPIVNANARTEDNANFDERLLAIDYFVHTSAVDSFIAQKDSVRQLRDNILLIYTVFPYRRAYADRYTSLGSEDSLYMSDMEYYRQMMAVSNKNDKQFWEKQLDETSAKYLVGYRRLGYLDASENNVYEEKLQALESSMYAIKDKLRFKSQWYELLLPIIIFACVFAVLLYIYRHTTLRVFWLSVLTGFIVSMLSGLIVVTNNGGLTSVNSLYCLITLACLIGALSAYFDKTRTKVGGICINLLAVALALLPTIIYTNLERHYSDDRYLYNTYPQKALDAQQVKHYEDMSNFIDAIAIYIPPITALFCLILVTTIFARLYKKWYSLPEQ